MPLALDLTYTDCEPVLNKVARSHASRYCLDYETIRADANTFFLAAYSAFNYKGRFEDYLAWFVHNRLRDQWRSEQCRQIHEQNAARERDQSYEQSGFVLGDFIEGLNPDAAAMIRVAVQGDDLPRRNKGGRAKAHFNKGGRRTKVHSNKGRPESRLGSIRRYLCSLGWTPWRVTKAVREIQEKL